MPIRFAGRSVEPTRPALLAAGLLQAAREFACWFSGHRWQVGSWDDNGRGPLVPRRRYRTRAVRCARCHDGFIEVEDEA